MLERKHWTPLESNPDVFTRLIHQLGVSSNLAFHDVFSLDPEMLALVPCPVLALVLVFPASSEVYEKENAAKDAGMEGYKGKGEEEDVVWFKQTIHNACGFYGILHAVCNGEARKSISRGKSRIFRCRVLIRSSSQLHDSTVPVHLHSAWSCGTCQNP